MAEFGLVAGNYWLRQPADPDLPWREFAINTWSEMPESALVNWLRLGKDLIAAQGHMAEGRLSRFSPPADHTQLWDELRLSDGMHLRFPHALASEGERFVVGENAGPGSRLLLFDGDARPRELAVTNGVHSAFLADGGVVTVGSKIVQWWPLSREDTRRPRSASQRAAAKTNR
jgi:hypothetical protein